MKRGINGIFVPHLKAFPDTISTGILNFHFFQSRTPCLLQARSLALAGSLGTWPQVSCGKAVPQGRCNVKEGRVPLPAHQACSAQMGSISVTYTMEPMAFRAAQHPFPTCMGKSTHHSQENTLLNASANRRAPSSLPAEQVC